MLVALMVSGLASGLVSLFLSILAGQSVIEVLAFYSLAGSCGVTACAVRLANVLEERGRR